MAKEIGDIQKLVKKNMHMALLRTSEDFHEKISAAYDKTIDKFYSDYSPLWYKRTYSTYKASSTNAFGLWNDEDFIDEGDSFTVGTRVSPEFIPGNPYLHKSGKKGYAQKEWVFKNTFKLGVHGIWAFKEKERTRIKRFKSKNGERIFMTMRTMKNTIPAPQTSMDEEFNRITKRANVTRVFEKHFKSLMNF